MHCQGWFLLKLWVCSCCGVYGSSLFINHWSFYNPQTQVLLIKKPSSIFVAIKLFDIQIFAWLWKAKRKLATWGEPSHCCFKLSIRLYVLIYLSKLPLPTGFLSGTLRDTLLRTFSILFRSKKGPFRFPFSEYCSTSFLQTGIIMHLWFCIRLPSSELQFLSSSPPQPFPIHNFPV